MQEKINPNFPKKLLLASPRGFCAGVKRAIEILNNLLEENPNQTIYCYHQIVHNTHVVKNFESKGVKFVDNLDEVPGNSILVFSSHGVSPKIKAEALKKKLKTIDATCPYVIKTHVEVKKYAAENYQIIYIGQPNHDETIGTTGEAPKNTSIIQTEMDIANLSFPPTSPIALITQTTLSFDETAKLKKILKKKYPKILEPTTSDICRATQNKQNGVKEIIQQGAKIVIILGSVNSSNSNKLKMVAEKSGAKAYLIDEIAEIDPEILKGVNCIGLSAGASLPENKITEAIKWFKKHGVKDIEEIVVAEEKIIFPEIKI